MTDQKKKSGNQLINSVTYNTSLIFLDVQAYSSNPLYPSEIGCARVQNGKLLATLHTFISPSNLIEISQSKELSAQFYITKKLYTGIPVPWFNEFKKCQPCVKYEQNLQQFGSLLTQFCTASSQTLKNGLENVNVKLLGEFEEHSDFMFFAKGIDLENKVLSHMMGLENKVIETEQVYNKYFHEKIVFKNLHSHREFDFCAFHQKCPNDNPEKMKNCALDNAMYLAKIYLEKYGLDQKEVVFQDDEIVVEW
ncbi:Conserved_hypothetical protein [Hexamita inflata]|uniref:Uncharacterized protein n=1 Tax=Hexamita inflata TaxID=28002 RepID=A0AA86UZY1_9EUKA|nr:Conserved hypothetical protein [Hexamita inflata]